MLVPEDAVEPAAAAVAVAFGVEGQEGDAGLAFGAVAPQLIVLGQVLALGFGELDVGDAVDVAGHSDVDCSDSMWSFAYPVGSTAQPSL